MRADDTFNHILCCNNVRFKVLPDAANVGSIPARDGMRRGLTCSPPQQRQGWGEGGGLRRQQCCYITDDGFLRSDWMLLSSRETSQLALAYFSKPAEYIYCCCTILHPPWKQLNLLTAWQLGASRQHEWLFMKLVIVYNGGPWWGLELLWTAAGNKGRRL